MANMYVICLVLVLTMAVVQCTAPTCSSCTGSNTCKWTCVKDGHQIADADSTVCTALDDACGSSGKCKNACVASPVNPTCNPPTCTRGKTCKWTCKKNDDSPIVDAYITACTSENGLCGSAADSGTCKAACVPPIGQPEVTQHPGKTGQAKVTPAAGKTGQEKVTPAAGKTGNNGSIRHGLSPLMLIFGIFTKLFLHP